jgi:hypothetical protein
MGNDGTYADGNLNVGPGGTAIKLNKDVECKVSGLDLTKYYPNYFYPKYQITKKIPFIL